MTAALVPLSAALLVGSSGCSDAAKDLGCEASIRGRVDALQASVNTMVSVAAKMRADVTTACKNIAMAGGQMADAPAQPTDDDMRRVCAAAEAAITAKLSAAGTVSLKISPAVCRVNAQAQLDCEGKCEAKADCTEPSIEARCTGGNLSVQCSGMCTGTASCEGSATVKANCQGTCNATCEGTCSGTCTGECMGTCATTNGDGSCNGMCNGTCKGQCSANCMGTCTGKCELAANAMVTCNAEARCEGMCSTMGTAPKCEGEVTPPMCTANADCSASCKGSAELEASCTPPTVQFVFSGMVEASFVTALEANLGVFADVAAKAKIVGDAAVDVAGNFTGVVQSSATCAASLAAELKAAVDASVSIKASVDVSASASGKASAGS
jgi:hypothetical protein